MLIREWNKKLCIVNIYINIYKYRFRKGTKTVPRDVIQALMRKMVLKMYNKLCIQFKYQCQKYTKMVTQMVLTGFCRMMKKDVTEAVKLRAAGECALCVEHMEDRG